MVMESATQMKCSDVLQLEPATTLPMRRKKMDLATSLSNGTIAKATA